MRGLDAVKINRVFTCTLPCKEIFRERKVVLFSFFDKMGNEQWAEAAPLPGRNRETCDDVLQAIDHLSKAEPCPFIPPSLRFALDAPHLPPLTGPVEICRLLVGTPQQILKKAEKLHREGASCVKVKVTGLPIEEAASLVKELKKHFRLRIDANRCWSLQEGLAFARHFSKEDEAIEYFEEPLASPQDLKNFPLPFALDESLLEPPLDPLLSLPNLRALILKPSVFGGKEECLHWITTCRDHNLKWVISSAFESGIGTLQLARLYSALPSCGSLPGFDSYSYIEQDLLAIPLELRGGSLIPPKSIALRPDVCTL